MRKLEGEYQNILGPAAETNGHQQGQPSKFDISLQIKAEATPQTHPYSITPAVDHLSQLRNPNGTSLSIYNSSRPYPHPPLFPDESYPYAQYSMPTSSPQAPYPQFPPKEHSQQVQYTHATISTSMAPLSNETTPLSPPYHQQQQMMRVEPLGPGADGYADLMDERSYWPSSIQNTIHTMVYQGQGPGQGQGH